MPNYGDPKYWEDRYSKSNDETFDWLEDYPSLKFIIDKLNLNKETCKILNIGCGNSVMSEQMYDDGYHNIDNIDIAKSVIEQMKARSISRTGMTFEQMDVRKMNFDSNTYDLVIDKSTIDALLCGDNATYNVALMTYEVQRVLKTGGYYMAISYGIPENRTMHFKRKFLNFDLEVISIKKSYGENDMYEKLHYVYLCHKKEGTEKVTEMYYKESMNEIAKEEDFENELRKDMNFKLDGIDTPIKDILNLDEPNDNEEANDSEEDDKKDENA